MACAMKAQTKTQTKNKTTRKNSATTAAAFAEAKWYQDFVRHVELRDLAPSSRQAYLSWARRLQASVGRRNITKLREADMLDFLIALRHERGLKDSSVNQAACALRALIRSPPPAPSPFRFATGLSLRSSPSRT